MLHHHLLAQGLRSPQRVAVVHRDAEWTYAQLERRAAAYAHQLLRWGVRPGDRVAFVLDPCPEAVALIIACSMVAAVFVPLSPEMPAQRIDDVLRNVEPMVTVRHATPSPHAPQPVFEVDYPGGSSTLEPSVDGEAADLPPGMVSSDPQLPAYIIFTSGTTGRPKGIQSTHRAAISFFRGFSKYGVGPEDRLGSVAPMQFDFCLCDIGVALGSGATLVQVPRMLVHKQSAFVEHLRRKRVTIMHAVPSAWSELLAQRPDMLRRLTQLHTVMYAGEPFPLRQLRELERRLPAVRIVQGFGHSESIGCSFKVLPRPFAEIEGKVPVGRAIDGMEMFIVGDDGREITAPRVVGELYLKGDALFDGYWRDPALTDSVLVPDPRPGAGAARVFKSGDRVFVDDAGDFYACGRVDLMVKVRGYRVELEEIETRLAAHPVVARAAVVTSVQDGGVRLEAYVIATAGGKAQEAAQMADALRQHCAQVLPSYMQPAHYHFVDRLPLTENGKLARRRLAEATFATAST